MEQLKSMKDSLIAQVQTQLSNIQQADAHELGAAVDMIKDIAETEYYCSIVKAMEEKEEEKYYYTERYMPIPYQRTLEPRDLDRYSGKMYYDDYAGGSSTTGWPSRSDRTGGRTYQDMMERRSYYETPYMLPPVRDPREGRSASRRRMYMESKEMHQPKEKQIHELDSYMQELTGDITDMIRDASPEERQLLQQKLSGLVTKIDSVK